jgi:predicted patatin/cPLA2 family phospholipase
MYEECCSPQFANFKRLSNQIDFQYFIDVLRNSVAKRLDVARIVHHRSKILFGVTDFYTAEPELIAPVDEDGLFLAIEASVSLPNVTNRTVFINGKRYADGGFARPHIIGRAIERIEATHILLITNQDRSVSSIPWHERFLNETIFRFRMTYALRKAAHARRLSRNTIIEKLRHHQKIRLLTVWGDGSIHSVEQDPVIVRSVIERSRAWWRGLLPPTR